MNSKQKTTHNYKNEINYYFAPFTPQRAELRKKWGITRKCWNSFLYDQEKKYEQLKNKTSCKT